MPQVVEPRERDHVTSAGNRSVAPVDQFDRRVAFELSPNAIGVQPVVVVSKNSEDSVGRSEGVEIASEAWESVLPPVEKVPTMYEVAWHGDQVRSKCQGHVARLRHEFASNAMGDVEVAEQGDPVAVEGLRKVADRNFLCFEGEPIGLDEEGVYRCRARNCDRTASEELASGHRQLTGACCDFTFRLCHFDLLLRRAALRGSGVSLAGS